MKVQSVHLEMRKMNKRFHLRNQIILFTILNITPKKDSTSILNSTFNKSNMMSINILYNIVNST